MPETTRPGPCPFQPAAFLAVLFLVTGQPTAAEGLDFDQGVDVAPVLEQARGDVQTIQQGPESRPIPVPPKAFANPKEVLDYLSGLPNRSDKRVISGQFIGYGGSGNLNEINEIFKKTRHWVGMIGLDYHDYGLGKPNYAANSHLVKYWKRGGLITVSNHPNNPHTGGNVYDRNIDIADLLQPGTTAYTRWKAELDVLAEGLKELKDNGVVVLWRPYHEMNGRWFWWGGRDAEDFKALWRLMYHYFTDTQGLDNLLWVYSPDHQASVTEYYPGADYVDIVAVDVYLTDPSELSEGTYGDLVSFGKPMGLGEYGPGGQRPDVESTDFSLLIKAIQQKFPKTTFFQVWNEDWGMHNSNHRNADVLLGDPWIVNR